MCRATLAIAVAALASAGACPYAGRSLLELSNIDALHQKMPADDVHRALKPRPPPGSEFVAPKDGRVSDTLNAHLRATYPQKSLRNCSNFTLEELNSLIGSLVNMSHPAMGKLYAARCNATGAPRNCDKRSLRHSSLEQFEAEWSAELALFDGVPAHLRDFHPIYILRREGKCFETVNIFIHQLTEVLREAALDSGLQLPLLPRERALPPPHEAATTEDSVRRALQSIAIDHCDHPDINDVQRMGQGIDYSECSAVILASTSELHNLHPHLINDTNLLYYGQSPCQMAHSVRTPHSHSWEYPRGAAKCGAPVPGLSL